MNTFVILCACVAFALLILARRAQLRLQLSRAKHPSLAGHVRLARWVSTLVPFYEYDEREFFRVDDAPAQIAERRCIAFMQLTALYRERFPITARLTREVRLDIADLQFTTRYRVPFQFSAVVARNLDAGVFVASSSGRTVTDLDGNRCFDLTGSYGVNVFGYELYKECIAAGSELVRELGPVLGAFHPLMAYNVRRLREVSGLDEVSFHMSGTEAVMQAVRLARYHTGRRYLVRFSGSYHGWWGDVQPGVGNPSRARDTFTLKEMHESTLRVLRSRKDIACVLVNPLQALHPNAGAPADSMLIDSSRRAHFDRDAYGNWLQQLRQICTQRNIALVIDDVFLGFRLASGGSQEYFGVRADLVTYGKTVAGGLPIGVLCGRSKWMRRFREQRPADVCFARGTFNSHPYVMGAMHEFLRRLETPALTSVYDNLDERWNRRAARLNERLASEALNVRVANLSSVWTVCYPQPARYNWMFQFYLRVHGIALSWVGTGRLIFSLDFTEEEFSQVADRFIAAARQMQQEGWWLSQPALTNPGIRRRVLAEMLRARARRASDRSAHRAAGKEALGNRA